LARAITNVIEVALFVEMYGFPLMLVMFPILVTMYVRLARREEGEMLAGFGEEYRRYAEATPAFFPRFGGRARRAAA